MTDALSMAESAPFGLRRNLAQVAVAPPTTDDVVTAAMSAVELLLAQPALDRYDHAPRDFFPRNIRQAAMRDWSGERAGPGMEEHELLGAWNKDGADLSLTKLEAGNGGEQRAIAWAARLANTRARALAPWHEIRSTIGVDLCFIAGGSVGVELVKLGVTGLVALGVGTTFFGELSPDMAAKVSLLRATLIGGGLVHGALQNAPKTNLFHLVNLVRMLPAIRKTTQAIKMAEAHCEAVVDGLVKAERSTVQSKINDLEKGMPWRKRTTRG